jgi:uncharacterized membrane protein HdeD (DUF308 family)
MLKKMQAAVSGMLQSYRANGALVIVPGVAFTVFGIVAVMSPVLPGVDPGKLLGVLLISAGICRICLAVHSRSSGATMVGFGLAAVSFLTGLHLLTFPFLRHGYFTLMLAAYLVVDGVFSAVLSFQFRSGRGWGWLLTSALSTVVLGTMILYKWPFVPGSSSVVAVGLFLVLTGAALANLGVSGEGIAVRLTRAFGEEHDSRHAASPASDF